MPLAFTTDQPLDLNGCEYNDDDLAVLMLAGGRYGGIWAVQAMTAEGDVIGSFQTHLDESKHADLPNDPRYPYLAAETGFIWLREQTAQLGVQLLHFECLNHQYAAESAPYFCAAQFIVAGETFEPAPGVEYADQWTLDQAMAVRS